MRDAVELQVQLSVGVAKAEKLLARIVAVKTQLGKATGASFPPSKFMTNVNDLSPNSPPSSPDKRARKRN